MVRKQLSLALGVLLVIAGGVCITKFKLPLRMPTPQQLKSAFPGDTRHILEQSQRFTLLSLDLMDLGSDAPQPAFYGHHVYGRTQVSPKLKKQLMAALYNSMTNKHGFAAACFSPRHGIHAVLGNKAVDVLICFHCGQFVVYPNKQPNYVIISESAQPDFDQALTDAGVPLSPR